MSSHAHREISPSCNEIVLLDSGVLSPRQSESLLCVGEGLSSVDGALVMGCSKKTFEHHVEAVINKLGALNRPHMVAIAFSRGILGSVQQGKASILILVLNLTLASLFATYIQPLITDLTPGDSEIERVRQTPRRGGARRSSRSNRRSRSNRYRREKGLCLDDAAMVLGDQDLLIEMLDQEAAAV